MAVVLDHSRCFDSCETSVVKGSASIFECKEIKQLSESTDDSCKDSLLIPVYNDKSLSQQAVTVTELELCESELDDDSENASDTSSFNQWHYVSNKVREAFRASYSQWIDDPVISQWRHSSHHIHNVLSELDELHENWTGLTRLPFSSTPDDCWLKTGETIRSVGLPWHNNQINMPDEIDSSWPFHFKSFETLAIKYKGQRVGDPNASGYICNAGEANLFCIRALQQELRKQCPDQKPLLLYDQIDEEIVKSAERLFGLETCQMSLNERASVLEDFRTVTMDFSRPVIFAAVLDSTKGSSDDLQTLCNISEYAPLLLHIDASRSFDYITTLSDNERTTREIEKLTLAVGDCAKSIRCHDRSILASTIAAGGSNFASPAPVVALKPAALGSANVQVAYTRASDSTLAGSRDAIAPLWVALHEIRFGQHGFNEIFEYCYKLRESALQFLRSIGAKARGLPYSLNIKVDDCSAIQIERFCQLGGRLTGSKEVLLTIQPSTKLSDLKSVTDIYLHQSTSKIQVLESTAAPNFAHRYPVPQHILDELEATVDFWKTSTRSAAGYPFHMGSYSVLGPLVGQFLDVHIPPKWIELKSREIIEMRMKSFGLKTEKQRSNFKGAFTNGSTMGNRVGIHTALAHYPGAYVYFSKESHYSVDKTARDCDVLSRRWTSRKPRYAEIPCDSNGSMLVKSLVRQALTDQQECKKFGEEYSLILFANMGTTFVGARDNLKAIRAALERVSIKIAYIHMDGALDFGFTDCGVQLGHPGIAETEEGLPVVQGVTLSHHKAMGNMVSGEVICYSPEDQLATLGSNVDPRAIFETWLYLKCYTPADFRKMFEYSLDNADHLQTRLEDSGVVTKRNKESPIVVLERPPAWIIEEFSLRPEGDWVHFITMPHISPSTVNLFVDRIKSVDRQCKIAFSYLEPLLSAILGETIRFRRVQCRQFIAQKILAAMPENMKPFGSQECNPAIEANSGKISKEDMKLYLKGAMTIVASYQSIATDRTQAEKGETTVVIFCITSTRQRTIEAGPILISNQFSTNICDKENDSLTEYQRKASTTTEEMIKDIGVQLIGFIARHLEIRAVVTKGKSFELFEF